MRVLFSFMVYKRINVLKPCGHANELNSGYRVRIFVWFMCSSMYHNHFYKCTVCTLVNIKINIDTNSLIRRQNGRWQDISVMPSHAPPMDGKVRTVQKRTYLLNTDRLNILHAVCSQYSVAGGRPSRWHSENIKAVLKVIQKLEKS